MCFNFFFISLFYFSFLDTRRKKIFSSGKSKTIFNNFTKVLLFYFLETGRSQAVSPKLYLTTLLKYFYFIFLGRNSSGKSKTIFNNFTKVLFFFFFVGWVANGTDVLVVQPGYQNC